MSFCLGDEIESSSHSIFFTLTYNNTYVPKMSCRVEDGQFHWFSAPHNIRFNGVRDVLREPVDFYSLHPLYAPLKNYPDSKVVGYLCKSDIQLYLKLLRKDIYENLNISRGSFRYYIIGEYGPGKDPSQGKYRPHYHGIIIPCNSEVASFLLESSIYANWQMCDKGLFDQYTKYCDSGTRHYVTEYVTGLTYLPKLLQESKEIRPFALVSKQDAPLGARSFDRKEVSENIERGVDEYRKSVSRIERSYIFQYPSQVTRSLFPKCSRFNLLSFNGLLRVYEYLYNIRSVGYELASLFDEFCDFSSQDLHASRACLKVCDMMSWTPYHYVEVLVDFYYRKAMRALRLQYEWQKENISDPYKCISYYYNCDDFLSFSDYDSFLLSLSSSLRRDRVSWFLQSFGLTIESFDPDKLKIAQDSSKYQMEVDSIIESADKSKKVNSVVGLSPHIV